jgi:hypothetical protein
MIPKHLLINFDELRVGQRVWTIQNEYTTIKDLNCKIINNEKYPIETEDNNTYTQGGYNEKGDLFPSMFLDCPFIEEERVVEVSEGGEEWYKRVLILKKRNIFICWNFAQSIDDVVANSGVDSWKFMRELQPEPIKEKIKVSKQDIAKLMGCGVEEIEIV